ncbi:MAG: squalene/phytoene synthase family protein [Alphaproteobacteria bacterium]|nr:squalene/phytoene synthase family protein [Alphaproteobacteria bacterium]
MWLSLLKKNDYDRYLTILFVKSKFREPLAILYNFNYEIAYITTSVKDPLISLIKIQWWQDQIDYIYKDDQFIPPTPLLRSLKVIIKEFFLPKNLFTQIFTARKIGIELNVFETTNQFIDYARDTSSPLIILTLYILHQNFKEPLKHISDNMGIAWVIIGLLRSFAHYLKQDKIFLPQDRLSFWNVDVKNLTDCTSSHSLIHLAHEMVNNAEEYLIKIREYRSFITKDNMPAFFIGYLAEYYIKRLKCFRYNILNPNLNKNKIYPLLWLCYRKFFFFGKNKYLFF